MEHALRLEPFDFSDIDRLSSWLEDAEVFWYWTASLLTYPLDHEQYAAKVREAKETPPKRHIFRAVETTQNEAVGHIELTQLNPTAGTATIGRVLVAPAWQGRGIGKRLMAATIALAFDELGYQHLDLQVAEENLRARRCYESVGFVDDGPMWEDPKIHWMHKSK